MIENNENIKLQISSEKNFGFVFSGFFLIVSIFQLYNNNEFYVFTLAISFAFVILSLFFPNSLSIPNKLWSKLGIVLAKIVSPIIMGFVFFVTVTPTGIIFKLLKKDLLNQKKINTKKTSWIIRKKTLSSVKNQF